MLCGQMSPRQLEYVLNVNRNIPSFIKIGSVTAEILLTLSFCGGGVGWGGAESFYCQTQPCVEGRLGF